MGEFEVELYWKHAPMTCRNFAELARRGYYNGTKFHRIIKDFMIQGGDPTATGRGGASIYGKTFEDEIHPDLKHTGACPFSWFANRIFFSRVFRECCAKIEKLDLEMSSMSSVSV